MQDGSVELGEGGYENPSGSFPDTVHPTIYYRELYAVLLALRGLSKRGLRGIHVLLVGDSMAVIGSLGKRMGPPHAWWMLAGLLIGVRPSAGFWIRSNPNPRSRVWILDWIWIWGGFSKIFLTKWPCVRACVRKNGARTFASVSGTFVHKNAPVAHKLRRVGRRVAPKRP